MATLRYQFLTLLGGDKAGHTSINAVINDIDDKLYTRAIVPGTIFILDEAASGAPSAAIMATRGWADLGQDPYPSYLPDLSGSTLKYIRKQA